jgi:acetylglutamate kinase
MTNVAKTLIEALPYIQKFKNKIFVIKLGGSVLHSNKEDSLLSDIALLVSLGIKIILVHGGGIEISKLTKRLGLNVKFVDGLRYTNEETLNIVKMALGKINSELTGKLQNLNCNAIGTTGKSGKLIEAERIVKLGFVGRITKVNPKILNDLLDKNYLPVIQPIGVDKAGTALNINADEFASNIAKAVRAEKLIFISDIPGLLRNPKDERTLIASITTKELRQKLEWFELNEGMIPKAKAMINAIESGVKSIHLIDGRKEHSLLLEVFTDKGTGTMVIK